MKQFLLNWNFKKQLITEILGYAALAIVGNSLFSKGSEEKPKTINPIATYQQMTKTQKYFNGALIGTFAVDLTASYLLLKWMKKKYL
jgi:hypothetical protein